MSKMGRCLVVFLACLTVFASTKEVVELGDSHQDAQKGPEPGPQNNYDGSTDPTDTWGTKTGTETLNMPGPMYGLPGYKESHNWEDGGDLDYWMPVIFNAQFYKAMYADTLADKTEAEVRTDWKTVGNADDVKYPNCRQASDQFSLNLYYRANPGIHAGTEGVCKKILESYLHNGIYNGSPTYSASAEASYKNGLSEEDRIAYDSSPQGKARAQYLVKDGSAKEWPLMRPTNLGESIDALTHYSYTFWFNLANTGETKGNILRYGVSSPDISLAANDERFLEVKSGQTNNENWGCTTPNTDEFKLEKKKWTHIAVVAEDKKLTVYLNGKEACTNTNTAGSMSIEKDQTLFAPADDTYADGKIKNLKYWAGSPLNKELIEEEHARGPDV